METWRGNAALGQLVFVRRECGLHHELRVTRAWRDRSHHLCDLALHGDLQHRGARLIRRGLLWWRTSSRQVIWSYFRPLSLTADTRLASIRLCGRCLLTPTANCNIK